MKAELHHVEHKQKRRENREGGGKQKRGEGKKDKITFCQLDEKVKILSI